MRKQADAEIFRITGARQGLTDDVRGRQRRYVISMSVRTLSVVLAAVLWNVERHVAIVALALGILLPYVAVVIANAGRENAPSLPSAYVRGPFTPELAPAVAPEPEKPRRAPQPESDPESTGRDAAYGAGDGTGSGRSRQEREPG
ncbi:DUF3099 domain-containing protein [Streptomyces sp. NPDC001985]|uniref:DUF3099 domain-containing protein n=1 Tax=Streptomyces sp. NPDC001985 TaxID=3154406 RepID=UPI003333B688